jgi:hypothetical protein
MRHTWNKPIGPRPAEPRIWHIRDSFCDEAESNPRFQPIERTMGPEPWKAAWKTQLRNAETIDPVPAVLKAVRNARPRIAHPILPDLLTVGSNPVVSEAFRQILLELEPEGHQFVPISLFDEAGQPLPGTYWLLNVLQRRDCIISGKQIEAWSAEGRSLPEVEGYWNQGENGARYLSARAIFLDRAKIAGLHLWRSARQHMYPFEYFLSDELLQRIKTARLLNITPRPAVEIECPV